MRFAHSPQRIPRWGEARRCSALGAAFLILLLPIWTLASDLRDLKKLETPEGLSFAGLGLSLGLGLPVTAAVTFDRETAEAGGRIFVLRRARPRDLEAVRMSAAVVTVSGGLLGSAAVTARRHGVAAVLLRQARWEGQELVFDAPVYGRPSRSRGFPVRMLEQTVPVAVGEGDVVTVDPVSGRLWVYPLAEQEIRAAVAGAVSAFDGLKNTQGLLQWLEASPHPPGPLGLILLKELAPRVGGAAGAKDYLKVRRRVWKVQGKAGRAELKRSEALIFRRSLDRSSDHLREAGKALASAQSARAVSRILKKTVSRFEKFKALCGALGRKVPRKSAREFAAFERRADRRIGRLSKKTYAGPQEELADAAKRAGASVPERRSLPPDSFRRFLKSRGLEGRLKDLLRDSSLGLRRKSRRIRKLIRSARFNASDPAGRALFAVLPAGDHWAVIGGEDPRPLGGEAGLEPVKDFWATLFRRRPLGKRLRGGKALSDREATVFLEKLERYDIQGAALTRDPVSGSRERMSVTASCGEKSASEPDQYAVNRAGREVLPYIGGGKKRCLTPARLEKVSRAASALENNFGEGLEMRFSYVGDKLVIRWVRTLSRPGPTRLFALPPAP